MSCCEGADCSVADCLWMDGWMLPTACGAVCRRLNFISAALSKQGQLCASRRLGRVHMSGKDRSHEL